MKKTVMEVLLSFVSGREAESGVLVTDGSSLWSGPRLIAEWIRAEDGTERIWMMRWSKLNPLEKRRCSTLLRMAGTLSIIVETADYG